MLLKGADNASALIAQDGDKCRVKCDLVANMLASDAAAAVAAIHRVNLVNGKGATEPPVRCQASRRPHQQDKLMLKQLNGAVDPFNS